MTEVGIRIAPLYTKEEKTLWWHGTAWLCEKFGWVYQVEKTIRSHADRGCPATKKWYTLFYKSKVIIAKCEDIHLR